MSSNISNSDPRDADNTRSGSTVAGYFVSGEDAHRAINELLEEGFSARQIGAAFHSNLSFRSPGSRSTLSGTDDDSIQAVARLDASVAGAASGTNAVTPMGLSTGGGTVIAGAGNPGPIPGSEIPSTLPSDIPSDIASGRVDRRDASMRSNLSAANENLQQGAGDYEPRGNESRRTFESLEHESWWDKLKSVFGGSEHTDTAERRGPVSDKSSLNYGTGEGSLDIDTKQNPVYSGSAFESSFAGLGIPQAHSQRLSRELGRGGAVVTVDAGSRSADAEEVLVRNHGIIRYESEPVPGEEASDSGNQEARVEIFGEVHRSYPGFVAEDRKRERRAS